MVCNRLNSCVVAKDLAKSQSPYGAMWFATVRGILLAIPKAVVAIPLRGYVVCNPMATAMGSWKALAVAIPLRGYVVCNSTPLRTPFWTALSEGGL